MRHYRGRVREQESRASEENLGTAAQWVFTLPGPPALDTARIRSNGLFPAHNIAVTFR